MSNPVLIIQHSQAGLKMNESKTVGNKKYVLEGIFTEFNVKNRNNRIYTAAEFVPHLEQMMSRKQWGAVVYGEFDHPDVFDVSMKYVSHVIESATYNKEADRVDGEIRLTNTQWGKEAKALVDDGLPLFVSSRAAGVTEANDYVKLKQLFTYDIVADPGFSSARMNMKPMNESFGFKEEESDFRIYPISESKLSDMQVFNLTDETKTNDLFEMNKNDMVTKKQLSEYSVYLAKEIKKLKGDLTNKIVESKGTTRIDESVAPTMEYYEKLREQQDKVIQYLDYLAEKVTVSMAQGNKLEEQQTKMVKYSNYLAEQLDKNISYSEYIAENLDKTIDYSNYIAENLDKSISYGEYLAENLDKTIDYSNYIAENLDKSIDYSNYLAENLDKNIEYSEYIAENLDANIGYTEYIAENLDANIGYTEYIAENLDTTIGYAEYVAECADKTMDYASMIAEKLSTNGTSVNEKIITADQFLIKEGFMAKAACKVKGDADTKSKDKDKPALSGIAKARAALAAKKDGKTGKTDKTDKKDKNDKKHNDFISKMIDKSKDAASANKSVSGKIKENVLNSASLPKQTITSQIDTLIAEAKKREASKVQTPAFYSFLSAEDIKSFENLSNNHQENAIVLIKESAGYYSRHDVMTLIQKAGEKAAPSLAQTILANIPAEVQPIWESLSSDQKKQTLAQAHLYELNNTELVEHFWLTRPFLNQVLNEKKTLVDYTNPLESNDTLSDDYIERFGN